MARRLAIACALLHRPELVILDEPTSGLDPLGSAEVKDLISELKTAGTTILLCSHLLADVEDVCDKVAILYQGRLRAWGTVESLLRDDRRVTVELDRPDAATLAAVQAAAGSAFLRAGPPRERLEAVFKRVIAEARER
jgi:ABC-2 type transport system ATP-binding protein